jgi:hypothetical protein
MRSRNCLAVLLVVLAFMFLNLRISEADGGPPSVTLSTATGKGTVTLTTNHPDRCFFENAVNPVGTTSLSTPSKSSPQTLAHWTRTLLESALPEQDTSHDYPFGLIEFTLYCPGLEAAGVQVTPMTVDVTMTFSGSSDMSGYIFRKYGPTPEDGSPHWYDFSWDGTTGLVGISGNAVTLRYVDAQRGDDNTAAPDSYIYDQIGPSPVSSLAVPTVTGWGLLVFMLCAGLAGVRFLMRRRPEA